ncbi:uncharacterized protein LOC117515198 [Thalassophryne amazonica]|uniref:uncharacterized protein LOC117515198 n=1 Tax=Thalassophryne amazonica TaxID=390379 RepID=UPI001470D111|nr:uncharacterized protein LOC117515198 [Thalassophryne amazonica]
MQWHDEFCSSAGIKFGHVSKWLYSHLEEAGSTVKLIFFDFFSAFNIIWLDLLSDKVHDMKVEAPLVAWITNGGNSECESLIKVQRDTVYEVVIGGNLKITCSVVFCSSSPPNVSWFKFGEKTFVPVDFNRNPHIKKEWETLNHTEGKSYLVFQNILRNDSALYQCQAQGQISHAINLSISDHRNPIPTPGTPDATRSPDAPAKDFFWMYLYCAAAILVFVTIVIVTSVIAMRGCKGKWQKEVAPDNQYMGIPMCEQASPHLSVQAPQRASPSSHHALPSIVPEPVIYSVPARQSTRKKMSPSRPHDNKNVCKSNTEGGQRMRDMGEEEGRSIVYAALNHQILPGAAARPRKPREETSEYAAIRVS